MGRHCFGMVVEEHDELARLRLDQAASLYSDAHTALSKGEFELAFRFWGHGVEFLVEASTHAQSGRGWPQLEEKLTALAAVSRQIFDELLRKCL